MPLNLVGVTPDQIGDVYDVAIGYPNPTTGDVVMVGYVLSNQGTWQESTNLQDEEHLVQIASPASSDRFGRYPQVSQGDWSGGERQLIFVTGNQYYSSQQLDTSQPGHLKILGSYTKVTLPHAPVTASSRAISADGLFAYVCQNSLSEITLINHNTLALTEITTSANPFTIIRGGDAMYFLTNSGVWQMTDAHAVVQVTNQLGNSDSLAYFGGSIWYSLGIGTLYTLWAATYPFPGAANGTLEATLPQMESQIISVCDSATGLVIVTGDVTAGTSSYVYSFDGTTSTFIGAVEGFVVDSVQSNGTVYLLASSGVGTTTTVQPLPIIYTVVGSTISVFDDFRLVAAAFQPEPLITNAYSGHIAADGIYLYLFWPGLSVKRYLLRTSSPYDVGASSFVGTNTAHYGTPTIQGGFIEGLSATNSVWAVQPLGTPNVNGVMTTSWFDFDVPSVRKSFSSIEFTMNTGVDTTALQVAYQTDTQPGFQPLTVTTSLGADKLIAYLPRTVIATRIQFQITLLWNADQGAPDIADYTITGKLTRVWQFQVACRANQGNRAYGTEDAQMLTSQQLLANIKNAYDLASGNIVLYVPDPTIDQTALNNGDGVALGVSQVNAVLQDYQWTTAAGVSPAFRQANGDGPQTQEGDVALTISGSL